DARVAIREDIERARAALLDDGLDAKGARALAVFVCGPADLFEVVKLPRPVATHVTIDDSPWIEPLVRLGAAQHVAVALIDRHNLRLFHGTAESLEELDPDAPELRPPRDAGHVHERRHRTATDDEARAHFEHAGHALLALLKTRGYDALVLDARDEYRSAIVDRLHPYVRERPIDGTPLERRDDILENAAEAAVLQDAEVLVIDPVEHPDLGPHGGVGAVLRF